MAVLYAQTNLAAPFAHAAVSGPQAALAMSRVLATEMARQQQYQVEKAEKTEKASIGPDGRGGSGQQFGSRRRTRAFLDACDDDEQSGASASPLIGNLLNMKV